ncbi:NmrA family protein [Lacticaseibacillus sharpeae JCM 1186 = DSM 20505]|uniref:NmrA family protein n=2 Tax=Lacticaseibacillus sharpeae TaxID=1626 RepID=A0A0R1ZHX2_9LACO|nr:NmrA family protein [Lacticaseibacillus sharpeae JCM 1186 = DSM 20505]
MMSKILITGASGNVGSYVAQYALQQGAQVKLAGRNVDRLHAQFGQDADCVNFDFTDASTFAAALADVDRVFLMRPPYLGKPQDLKPFIEAMAATGSMKLVSFLSLIGVEHNPVPPHHKIEKYIEQAGLPYCHIRPSFFMQNLSGVHAFEIKYFNRIVVPVKEARTSFIDAEDIGELTANVLVHPERHTNQAYAITGSEALNYEQVARILSDVLGRQITYANPAPRLSKQYWINVRGLDPEYSKVMGMLYMMTRMGTAKGTTDVFARVMGKATQTFRQFAEKNRDAWL